MGKNKTEVKIGSPANFMNGKENTADKQSVNGFKPNSQKNISAFPLDDNKALDKARTEETGVTLDTTSYSSTVVRE